MIRVSSYNCKSLKRNTGGIAQLCNSSDIVFLQEHWLFPSDLPLINNIHADFVSYGVSSIDPSVGLIVGRPYGGVAVLWRNSLASFVKPLSFDDDRIIGLECIIHDVKFLFLGVYLPYNNRQNFDRYVHYLSKLKSIIDDYDSPNVCIIGDFNADVKKQSEFGDELYSFCQGANLKIADRLLLPHDSVTHVNDGSSGESWIDHIVCTDGFYSLLCGVSIDSTIVSSDHFPVMLQFDPGKSNGLADVNMKKERDGRWFVDWSSIADADISNYYNAVEDSLSMITVPLDALRCSSRDCHLHIVAICDYYESIIGCVRDASRRHVASKKHNSKQRVIPGWSEFVDEKHKLYGDLYSLWALIGKPRDGYIQAQLRIAKAQFKYALRYCLKNENALRAKALADKFVKNPRDLSAFWKEVRKLNCDPPVARSVAGVSGADNVAEMWKDHFSEILNSVKNDSAKDAVFQHLNDSSNSADPFSVHEITSAIAELTSGRSPGCDELYAEHYKVAGVPCAVHLAMCFSMMLSHNILPPSLTRVVLCPIVKDKNGDISSKDNYRPVALATVSSKILERAILNRCKVSLATSDHQFGFKEGHSTDMAVYALKEVVDYYLRNRSSVFVCFMDARKAFDRVNHWTLFEKLIRRGVNVDVVRLLSTWYESQKFHVLWGNHLTEGFHVTNGVRQGGILSPYLFNVLAGAGA